MQLRLVEVFTLSLIRMGLCIQGTVGRTEFSEDWPSWRDRVSIGVETRRVTTPTSMWVRKPSTSAMPAPWAMRGQAAVRSPLACPHDEQL